VAVGLGGAAIVAGFVTGGLAAGDKSDLDELCVDAVCDTTLQDDVDSYNLLRNVSTGTFVTGGVLLAGGVALLLFAPSPEETTTGLQLRPIVGPTAVGVHGTF
jgi:hypothetical protein